jgi:hypothetical protein
VNKYVIIIYKIFKTIDLIFNILNVMDNSVMVNDVIQYWDPPLAGPGTVAMFARPIGLS